MLQTRALPAINVSIYLLRMTATSLGGAPHLVSSLGRYPDRSFARQVARYVQIIRREPQRALKMSRRIKEF